MSLCSEPNLRCSVSDVLDISRQQAEVPTNRHLHSADFAHALPQGRTYPIRMALEFLMSPKSTSKHIRTWNRSRPRYPSHLQQTKTWSAKENWCVKSTDLDAIVTYGENTSFLFSITTSKVSSSESSGYLWDWELRQVKAFTQHTQHKQLLKNETAGVFQCKVTCTGHHQRKKRRCSFLNFLDIY